MDLTAQFNRPKIAETVVHSTASIRDSGIGKCCEILADTALNNAELGTTRISGPVAWLVMRRSESSAPLPRRSG